jgi:hypothetical protein
MSLSQSAGAVWGTGTVPSVFLPVFVFHVKLKNFYRAKILKNCPNWKKNHQKWEKFIIRKHGMIGVTLRFKLS